MNYQDPKAALSFFESELKQATEDFQRAMEKRDSLRQVVLGLRAYLTAMNGAPRQEQLFEPRTNERVVAPIGKRDVTIIGVTDAVRAALEDSPRGRDAVRRIAEESDADEIDLDYLVAETERRGWMHDAQNLRVALNAAANRLVTDGYWGSVGRGRYRKKKRLIIGAAPDG